jgi:VWFA-related protein
MGRRPLTLLLAVFGSCALLLAQGTGAPQTPPPQQTPPPAPAFRTRVDAISVDATVTDRQGRPVVDLTAEDFEIREAGKVQTIESFRFIQAADDGATRPEPAPPILSKSQMDRETANPENRLFIIFLDDYHTRLANSLHIRPILARWVRDLTSHDLVAIMYPLTTVAAVTWSRDHDGDATAIMNFQGRKFDYKPVNRYEDYFAELTPEQQESIRNDITIRTLQSACSLLATLRDGRKTLVYVSEGMAANIPAGALTSSTLFPPRTIAPPSTGAMQSYEFFRSSDLLGRMRDMFTVANRGNTAVYTLDPRGLAPSEFGAGDRVDASADQRYLTEAIDSLKTIADETGGRAITGKNDPLPDLKRMVRELSAYYLLGYTSSLAPRDGRFHEIQVRVSRKDVDIRARKGYWAYSEDELKRAAEPPKAGPPGEVAGALDTLAAVVEPTSRRSVVVWMGAVRGETERAQVTLVWEAPPGIQAPQEDRVERVSITASSGTEVLFKGVAPRDPGALRPAGRVTFAAPAGPIRLKLSSENARGQKLETEDLTDVVPDFSSPGVAITAPQVFRARTPRDIATLRATPSAIPSATRQFSRTERLFLRFEAYGPAGTRPDVSLRLLNRIGQPLGGLPAPTAASGSTFEADLGLASLPQGDYIIEITAVTPTDKGVRLLGVRITG